MNKYFIDDKNYFLSSSSSDVYNKCKDGSLVKELDQFKNNIDDNRYLKKKSYSKKVGYVSK